MRILGIIPARGGSKGVPRKNIKLLGDKPLIEYTIKSALESKKLSEIIVSTEDDEIAQISKKIGAKVPFMRPRNLAEDDSPTIDTILFVLREYHKLGEQFDAVCILQPTTPFRPQNIIDTCISRFEHLRADTLLSVKRVPDHFNPHWVFEENESGFLKISTGDNEIITRRQILPASYYRDGMIYIVKSDVLLKKFSLYGEKIVSHITDEEVVNIDTMEDWIKAENYLIGKKL